jgi:16S rRNA (guanine527-N7)-methyltransferase
VTFDEFRKRSDVSRETFERLSSLVELLLKWSKRINLISQADEGVIWYRHVLDSVQVAEHGRRGGNWLDIGSGGGLPGLVVQIIRGREETPMTMIESDQRKCAFLRTASRELDLHVEVICDRIERTKRQSAVTVSARALAPLDTLLRLATRHGTAQTTYLFPKGRTWNDEVAVALETWRFDLQTHPSRTSAGAMLLQIENVRPHHS